MGFSNGGFSLSNYSWSGKGSTKRIQIFKILNGQGELTTAQILYRHNEKYRIGLTMNELANILHRTKEFKRTGYIDKHGNIHNHNLNKKALCLWRVEL